MRVVRLGGLCVAVVLLAASCSLRRPAVSPATYTFDIPVAARGPSGGSSISVLPFTAGSRGAGQMFLYRVDEARYERDFYNRFLSPPARMLTGALRRNLSQARAGQVREPGAPLGSDLVVQPRLTELYADYREVSRPRAAVTMVIVLIKRDPAGNREIFERTYRREIPMKAVSPAAAVEGWSEGIGQIFWEFTRDLRRES